MGQVVCRTARPFVMHSHIQKKNLEVDDSIPNLQEDHVAGKGNNPLQHCNFVHKFIPMPQAMKNPAAKAVDKEWEKLEKIFGVKLNESQK